MDLFYFLGNLFLYISNQFSIKKIILSFFSPWKRFVVARAPGLDGLRDWILDNTVSRIVGMIMRSFMILFYLVSIVMYLVFSVCSVLFWLGMPVIFIYSIIYIFGGV